MNECLCVLSNNFASMPKANIAAIFSEFYTETEMEAAKKVLYDIADSITPKLGELNKIKQSRVGDGKLRRDVDDVLQLYTLLDVKRHAMPRMLAADSSRIPAMKDMELCRMTASIAELSAKFNELSQNVITVVDSKLKAQADVIATLTQDIAAATSVGSTVIAGGQSDGGSNPDTATTAPGQPWTTIVRGRNVVEGQTRPTRANAPAAAVTTQSMRRKIIGSRAVDTTSVPSKLSASPPTVTIKTWHIFVGKLNKECTKEDIKEFLEQNDISVSEVRKMEATRTWQKEHSAFRVSVALKCKDAVMMPALWPDNVEVRDWYFKPRP